MYVPPLPTGVICYIFTAEDKQNYGNEKGMEARIKK